jgi:catechol 2,3-dioxygenase
MGAVQLIVSDLQRSVAFWTTAVGLRVHAQEAGIAQLGAGGEDLVVLEELRGAPQVGRHTGLFHVALLLPDVRDLAGWLVHAGRDRVPLTGLSDHLVSEAIYLDDPDGHGIEIYRDRPRDAWRWTGDEVEMATLALDTERLLGTLGEGDVMGTPFDGMPDGTIVGHVHLRVADIPATEAFYRDVVGFDLITEYGDQAAFLAAGRYHHHIGANTWMSARAEPAPIGSATLRHATIVFPDAASRDAAAARVADDGQEPQAREDGVLVRDPSQNSLLLTSERP